MEEESGFDSVQWDTTAHDPTIPHFEDHTSTSQSNRRPSSNTDEPQAGDNADALDLAGIGITGTLDCTVDSPMKENDGTKDAYVSYKITTHVWLLSPEFTHMLIYDRPTSNPS